MLQHMLWESQSLAGWNLEYSGNNTDKNECYIFSSLGETYVLFIVKWNVWYLLQVDVHRVFLEIMNM